MKEFFYLHDTRQRFAEQVRYALAASLLLTLLLVTGAGAQSGSVQSGNATPSSGQVSVARLNLRVSPSISASVVTRLTQGDTVTTAVGTKSPRLTNAQGGSTPSMLQLRMLQLRTTPTTLETQMRRCPRQTRQATQP